MLGTAMRFQFPFYKMFVIVAVYAVAFRLNAGAGVPGAIVAFVAGTAGAGLLLTVRRAEEIGDAIYATVGSLIGLVISLLFVSARIPHVPLSHEVQGMAILTAGVALGGFLFSCAHRMDNRMVRRWHEEDLSAKAQQRSIPIQADVEPLGGVGECAGADAVDAGAGDVGDSA